jgi:hypothetical protein
MSDLIDQKLQNTPSASAANREAERIDVWAADIRFVLDQLEHYNSDLRLGSPWFGRIDEANIGAFGHSMAGRAIARACRTDKRINACLNEDGILSGGLPFMPNRLGRSWIDLSCCS